MRRLIFFSIAIIIATSNLRSSEVITNLDIAKWYLDADLVLICSASNFDTLFLKHYDSHEPDSSRLTYDIIREVYQIITDSIIKFSNNHNMFVGSIYSQDFYINYSRTKQGAESYIYKLNQIGDTIGVDSVRSIIMYNDDYQDNSYFRLENSNKHLVILSLTPHGYIINYATEVSDWILKLITELRDKGQAYIDDYFKVN